MTVFVVISIVLASMLIGARAQAAVSIDDTNPSVDSWRPNGGITFAMEHVGGKIVFGGNFQSMIGPEGQTVTRRNLAAIDAATGELLDWNPAPNGTIRSLESSPDGAEIYVGGGFQSIAGQSRSNIALVSLATGQAQPFRADTNNIVMDMDLVDGSLFVAGHFWRVSGQMRGGGAELDPTTGGLRDWNPRTNLGGECPCGLARRQQCLHRRVLHDAFGPAA